MYCLFSQGPADIMQLIRELDKTQKAKLSGQVTELKPRPFAFQLYHFSSRIDRLPGYVKYMEDCHYYCVN